MATTQVPVEYKPQSLEERILLIACMRNFSREDYERFEEMVRDLQEGKFESQYTELVKLLRDKDKEMLDRLIEIDVFLADQLRDVKSPVCGSCEPEKPVRAQKAWWED